LPPVPDPPSSHPDADVAAGFAALRREIARQEDELARLNEELTSFSYMVSHDLRAPLRGIDGFSQALLEDCRDQLDDQGKQFLAFVRESAQQMSSLLEDLVAFSHVSRFELRRGRVDLSSVAGAVVAKLRAHHPDRAVDVVIEPAVTANGDKDLLTVVLESLVGNAWKFTSRATAPRIEFGRSPNGYFVRDNGIGFEMAYADKLFGVFRKLHSPKDFEGNGIGLAKVRRIVHRHGGKVWGEGKVGAGATFTFTLPG
jgi:light-regulated signal transduction histidine kinase (bacteriophytochrome)